MKGQKQAVIDEVFTELPNFQKYSDNAILLLSATQLEAIKHRIYGGILNNSIEYSKDRLNSAEVRTYARSMVMNHLKKAKELNGGHVYVSNSSANTTAASTSNSVVRVKVKVAPKGVNPDILPDDLREYVKTLV